MTRRRWCIDQRRTVAEVARELGVVEQTLGNWVRQERIDRGEREGTSSDLRAENARLSARTSSYAWSAIC